MKITLNQIIALKNINQGFRCIEKSFESNIIPHKGDFINDSLWKDPYEYEIGQVTIDYSKNSCEVQLHAIFLESTDENDVKEYVKIAKLHGWKCNID